MVSDFKISDHFTFLKSDTPYCFAYILVPWYRAEMFLYSRQSYRSHLSILDAFFWDTLYPEWSNPLLFSHSLPDLELSIEEEMLPVTWECFLIMYLRCDQDRQSCWGNSWLSKHKACQLVSTCHPQLGTTLFIWISSC